MRHKTATFGHRKIVQYDKKHWEILNLKRGIAADIMENLVKSGLFPLVYGSVARGDVKDNSDVDIFIPHIVPSYKVELLVDWIERRIVQATPNYAIKGELILDKYVTISFPLVKLKDREIDFYRFGGCIDFKELKNKKRVCGVNKKLVLIIPEKNGHREIPINEMQPSELAKILGVCVDIVEERIRVLKRRREVGRTGVFLTYNVPPGESFESALEKIARKKPAIRKLIRSR